MLVPHKLSSSDSILTADSRLHHILEEALIVFIMLIRLNDYINVLGVVVEEELAHES